MSIELDEVKLYLRITHSEEDEYIERLITMAEQYINEQTNVEYSDNDETYKQAVLLAVAHFYDKRESVSDKTHTAVPMTLDYLIKQIGMREEAYE